jgi:multidrug efflux pump subunit AcrA (membrane-fusion protein)
MAERKDLSLEAAAILANHRLAKMDGAGKAVYLTATATDIPLGVTRLNAKTGEDVSIAPINLEGTVEITAAGAISRGADVYAAAEGKIQALPGAAGTYRKIGQALQAASGDGSIIEVLPYDHNTVKTV